MSDKPRIAICVPTRDLCAAEFAKCLADMVGQFCTRYVGSGQAELTTIVDLGTLLPDMRNALTKEAIRQEATHILWLDSDMTFPADTLERLYQRDLPVVGAGYSQRKSPARPVAATNGVWLYTEEDSTGVEPVDYIGQGVLLVQTDVYKHLAEPWHQLGWHAEKNRVIGEDVYFCRQAAAIGAVPHIDHDLTKEIGHIGYRTFTYKDALADRPALLAKQNSENGKLKVSE